MQGIILAVTAILVHNLAMEKRLKSVFSNRAIISLAAFICVILIGAVLKIASTVILPFTIAVLLSCVMYPMVRWMNKRRIPLFISIFLVVIILTTALCTFGIVLFTSGSNIVAVYPKYEDRVTEIYLWIAQVFELSFDESLSIWENIWGQLGVRTWVQNFAFSFLNTFLNIISSAVIVILFVIFILMEASFFKEKLETAFHKRSIQINQIAHDLMTQVTRYLTAKFFISLANGIIYAIAFSIIGLEFAILWGIIQFVMNFIPNLGSIATGVAISLFALVQFWPDPAPVITIVAIVLGINLILCNIFDPKIVGASVGLSTLMVLLSLAVWGWIWGFAGMVLAVPMTVIVKIVCENIPIMEPVSILIGSRKSAKVKKAARKKYAESDIHNNPHK